MAGGTGKDQAGTQYPGFLLDILALGYEKNPLIFFSVPLWYLFPQLFYFADERL